MSCFWVFAFSQIGFLRLESPPWSKFIIFILFLFHFHFHIFLIICLIGDVQTSFFCCKYTLSWYCHYHVRTETLISMIRFSCIFKFYSGSKVWNWHFCLRFEVFSSPKFGHWNLEGSKARKTWFGESSFLQVCFCSYSWFCGKP